MLFVHRPASQPSVFSYSSRNREQPQAFHSWMSPVAKILHTEWEQKSLAWPLIHGLPSCTFSFSTSWLEPGNGNRLEPLVRDNRSHVVCFCHSVTKSCPTLCSPMDCSTPGSPAFTISRSLLKFTSRWQRNNTEGTTVSEQPDVAEIHAHLRSLPRTVT